MSFGTLRDYLQQLLEAIRKVQDYLAEVKAHFEERQAAR